MGTTLTLVDLAGAISLLEGIASAVMQTTLDQNQSERR